MRLSLKLFTLAVAAGWFAGLTSVPELHAMSVSPTHLEMVSVGRHSRASIRIVNTSSELLPIEVVVDRLTVGEQGEQTFVRDDENFLVFPPQALIAPGATQVVKLQWVGEPLIKKSQSYKISIKQLPVKLPEGRSALQIVLSFGVIVNVAPPQGLPELVLVKTDVARGKEGKRYAAITVRNPSSVHALLPQATIRLRSGKWSLELPPATLRRKVGIGLVQPGATRRFVLPVELPAGVTGLQASIDFTPSRRR